METAWLLLSKGERSEHIRGRIIGGIIVRGIHALESFGIAQKSAAAADRRIYQQPLQSLIVSYSKGRRLLVVAIVGKRNHGNTEKGGNLVHPVGDTTGQAVTVGGKDL